MGVKNLLSVGMRVTKPNSMRTHIITKFTAGGRVMYRCRYWIVS